MNLAERLLSRGGLLLMGLPITGRSCLLNAAAAELACLGQVVHISGSRVEPPAFAGALQSLVSDNNVLPVLAMGGVAAPASEAERLFLAIDDFGSLLRSSIGDRINLLLGTATFADSDSASVELFTSACLLRGELGPVEDSMSFTDRAARVYIGQPEAPFWKEAGIEKFGGWAGVGDAYRSDPVAGLGRARTVLRRELAGSLVGALTFDDIHLLLSVLRRQRDGAPRRWDPEKYAGLAPLVSEDQDHAIVPEEFVRAELLQVLDLGEACAAPGNRVRARARWFGSRCSKDISPLWWDGHFGEQGTRPVEFLRFVMGVIGRDRRLRVLVHRDAIDSQKERFDELREAIRTNDVLANVDVRATQTGGQQGLHDRQLYLPSLQRTVKLPIYTKLAGPYPPGDYTETWATTRFKFQEIYANVDRAFEGARPL